MSKPRKILSIFIGDEEVDVRVKELEGMYGYYDGEENTIYLSKAIRGVRRKKTLVHEVGHAIIEIKDRHKAELIAESSNAEKIEEVLVEFNVNFYVVLLDNPELIKFLNLGGNNEGDKSGEYR